MAIERANPLPIGRYWVDVFEPDRAAFLNWIDANAGKLNILVKQYYMQNAGGPARNWFLFDVLQPVDWEGPGFPTIATEEVHTSEDTAQKPPPPPSLTEELDAMAQTSSNAIKLGIGAAIAYVVYRVLSK